MTAEVKQKQIEEIFDASPKGRAGLIPALQKIQDCYGYLPEEGIDFLGGFIGLTANEIYGVATFYTQFRFVPPGKHTIRVCQGTACHVRQGVLIRTEVERQLKIKTGETTKNGLFNLESVACLGCCALAPVMVIDEKVYARMTPKKISSILSSYSEKDKTE